MIMKLIWIVLAILVAGLIRDQLTKVRFDGVKASVSTLYCRYIGATNTKPVIFLPGIKGSLLEREGKTTWLNLRLALRDTAPFLYAPDAPMTPAGIMSRINIIPGLLSYSPYHRITATLACNPNAYFFAYDWRRPPMDNVNDLVALVERVNSETGQKPSIVSHSMGGLLTHVLMKNHATKVDKVVYVGVPFRPGIGFMDDLNNGVRTGMNRTILSKEATFSHPSSFVLLPHDGDYFYQGKNLMDIRTWIDGSLSVFADGDVNLDAFRATLANAKAFHAELDRPVSMNNEFLLVNGNCHDVIYSTDALGKQTVFKGDGRVAEPASFPVEKLDLNMRLIHSCAKHDVQLNDKQVVTEIVKFLR